MKYIGIETSGALGSVAVGETADEISEQVVGKGGAQGRMLIPTIDALLSTVGWQRQQIQAVALSVGPGSFTGLRVGVAAAKALAYPGKLPIYEISSLEVLARNAEVSAGLVCPLVNAFSDLLYCGIWRVTSDRIERCVEDFTGALPDVLKQIKKTRKSSEAVLTFGSGARQQEQALQQAGIDVGSAELDLAGAGHLVRIAMATGDPASASDWSQAAPRYLHQPEYKTAKKPK